MNAWTRGLVMKPSLAECSASNVNTRRLVSSEADHYFYKEGAG